MTDRDRLEDRVRRYMEQRAHVDVPTGLDARVIEAVRARTGRPRRLTELVLTGAVAALLIVALVTGIVIRGRQSASPGVPGATSPPADPCLGAKACLTIEADVSGAELLHGQQRRPVSSCSAVLLTDSEGTVLPRLTGELDGHSVSSFLLVPSARSGTYQYQASQSYPSDVLDVDGRHFVDAATGTAQTASGTVTIGANGSGAYVLRGLFDAARPSATASVEVSWLCTAQ